MVFLILLLVHAFLTLNISLFLCLFWEEGKFFMLFLPSAGFEDILFIAIYLFYPQNFKMHINLVKTKKVPKI